MRGMDSGIATGREGKHGGGRAISRTCRRSCATWGQSCSTTVASASCGSRSASHGGAYDSRGGAYESRPSTYDSRGTGLYDRQRGGEWESRPSTYTGASRLYDHTHSRDFSGDGYDHYDLGGGGSGSTSRRHSVSVVQPRRLAGFNAPEAVTPTVGSPGTGGAFASSTFGSSGRGGGGGLLLSDDDLEGLSVGMGGIGLGGGPGGGGGPLSPTYTSSHAAAAAYATNPGNYGGGTGGGGGRALSPLSPTGSRFQDDPRGAGVGGAAKESWADAYFSPPRPGLGLDTAFASHAPYEGAGPAGQGQAYRSAAPLTPLSPSAGVGAGRGFYPPTGQQQQYAPGPSYAGARGGDGYGGQAAPPHNQSQPSHAQSQGPAQAQAPLTDLGKGLPLHAVPPDWPLYIVEFKAGRTDLFYRAADRERGKGANGSHSQRGGGGDDIRVGDLVIVEADRGKDLGKVVNDSITLGEVEAFWAGQARFGGSSSGQSPPTSPGGAEGAGGGKKEIAPKMIYGKAGPGDAQLLVAKMQDEMKALALCQTKVRAKKLPMEVVDAEYQWDRRKLTFYFVAEKRIDFRELVRELFRLYKTRIWMASLQGASGFEQ
ncbi:PSP1 C-terminal conserved region-domain-containing protein [Mycena galericulata]|nr:PSP1 C-terminal conserved region-domain-containing protein [Mycena galericulata]